MTTPKTDRKLLELAAKAARFDTSHEWNRASMDMEPPVVAMVVRDAAGRLVITGWNPLTDDGDALRLAVKLRLSIDHNHLADQQRWVAADRNGCEGVCSPVSAVEDEFEESGRADATRRAIVRAAAAIGRAMP